MGRVAALVIGLISLLALGLAGSASADPSADYVFTVNGGTIAPEEEAKASFEGFIRFTTSRPFVPVHSTFGCQVTITINVEGPSKGRLELWEPTTGTCVETGVFKGCILVHDTNNPPWQIGFAYTGFTTDERTAYKTNKTTTIFTTGADTEIIKSTKEYHETEEAQETEEMSEEEETVETEETEETEVLGATEVIEVIKPLTLHYGYAGCVLPTSHYVYEFLDMEPTLDEEGNIAHLDVHGTATNGVTTLSGSFTPEKLPGEPVLGLEHVPQNR